MRGIIIVARVSNATQRVIEIDGDLVHLAWLFFAGTALIGAMSVSVRFALVVFKWI